MNTMELENSDKKMMMKRKEEEDKKKQEEFKKVKKFFETEMVKYASKHGSGDKYFNFLILNVPVIGLE